eukprot:Nitzschia sp. Nitz4//scaffold132_size63325//24078//24896//NITZ4_006291-RA/size63325-exonerate_est2genome-gene-0.7-mRNA-1//-1//CDS//3329535317//1974//frame0
MLPLDLPEKCDGCPEEASSVQHSLQWQELCSQVHPPSAGMNEPIIPTSQTLEETATDPGPELRGDVAVRGFP